MNRQQLVLGNSRSIASAQCEPASLNRGRLAERANDLEKTYSQFCNTYTEICKELSTWNPHCHAEGTDPLNLHGWITEESGLGNAFRQIPKSFDISVLVQDRGYVIVLTFPRKLCCGSKKWRWPSQWTTLRRRTRLAGEDSRNLRCLMPRLRSPWRRSSWTPTSRRKSVWMSKRLKCKTDFSVESRLCWWSTLIFGSLGHMKLFWITQICSVSLFHGDDIPDLNARWDHVSLSTSEVPNDKILESWYKMRIPESDQLQTALVMHEQEIIQDQSKPRYQKSKTMVKRHIDQKIRTRHFQARNERIETGILVKSRKGKHVSVERKSGECYQWKAYKRRCLQLPPRWQVSVERKHNRLLLLEGWRHKNDGRKPSKGKSARGSSLSGWRNQKACRQYFERKLYEPVMK